MKLLACLFVILTMISGCATSSISHKDAQPVQLDRVFLKSDLLASNNSTVVFIRDVGFVGSGVYHHIFIDGKKAASLNPGERVEFVLSPGEHIFGVIPTDAFNTHALNSIDQDLKPGKKYFYRVQTDGNSFRTVVQRFLPETE
ncbi:hypothetical protein [Polaromonas sp.]|uniref:hypothetical protein n=1 Tax=Polaromonas sp. TaxID=1869339 RepID=UPI003264E291